MSLTLAIASATPGISVAVGDADKMVDINLSAARRHGESLAPCIEAATHLAGIRLADLQMVAVDRGPGLFTGLRVGVATAKAMASALGIPLAARTSLEVLAFPHRHSARPVASVVDARRGQVFWAAYKPGGDLLCGPSADSPEAAAEALVRYEGLIVTGDGARRYLVGQGGWTVPGEEWDHPRASSLLAMVADDAGAAPEETTPLYMRGADVRIGWDQR